MRRPPTTTRPRADRYRRLTMAKDEKNDNSTPPRPLHINRATTRLFNIHGEPSAEALRKMAHNERAGKKD
jgi:hypothetical protein